MARRIVLRSTAGAVPPLTANAALGTRFPPRAVIGGALVGAAAVESPAAGAVLGAVSLLAWRRHWPRSSVVGAALVGALSTAGTLMVFPRVPERPARAVAIAARHRVEPSPTGEGLIAVVNPGSGSGSGAELVDELVEELPAAAIRVVAEGAELDSVLAEAASACRTLGVVGGDGTVNAAARTALEADVPIVVFPGGTLNHFARDLGLDSVHDSAEAVRSGHVAAIDVGTIADRPFVNSASLGSYSALVDERERLERRVGKWPAMVIALVRVLHRGERFEVVLDGEPRTVWMVFFGNCGFEPAGFAPASRADLADGLLDVRLIDAERPMSRLRLVTALLFGAVARSQVYDRRMVTAITVRSAADDRLRLTADGEVFDGPRAFVVRKRPAALLVYVMENAAGSSCANLTR